MEEEECSEVRADPDKETYLEFLKYCDERRKEWVRQEQGDDERKRENEKKEEHWALMRESIKFLKENEKGWQQRRIGEVDRIKEEEKMERLAICEQKRKRYGIRKLNKEDQKRIRERKSERIEIA